MKVVLGFDFQTKKLEGMMAVAKNAGWFLPHKNACWISERHSIVRKNQRGQLHCLDGAAVLYPDEFGVWAHNGVRASKRIIENPKSITVPEIESEQNVEIRRVMIEKYGQSRYLLDSGAKLVHSDDFGTLYRKEINGDEPMVMVKVINSTPEPDGSFKDYFLRVDPSITKAREAVAWTFDIPENAYLPKCQT